MTTTARTVAGATELLVGGQWRAASDGSRFDVSDPADAEVIASVASASVEDAEDAVRTAAGALADWAATPPRARSEVLHRAFELMTGRQGELALLVSRENGKALHDARAEITYAAEFLRWYAEEAVRTDGSVQTAPGGANRIVVLRRAIGVAVLVTPWNFPAAMATRKIAPALAAGCSVVLKPASDTPLTALALGALLAEAGTPPGVVNVLPAHRSAPAVSAMLAMPQVRKLSFTGSTEVGKNLLRSAADQVLNCSMELGGNAPFVVLAGANIHSAVDGAMIAKMRNGGEACTAANRFIVHESLADAFAQRLAERMADLTMGPGAEESTELGPLITDAAVQEVDQLVRGAVADGAVVLTGGSPTGGVGHFYPPTVLDQVPPAARILREEIFGPVAPIVRFSDVDEAVSIANDTEYGLAAYLYAGDLSEGLRAAERLEAGIVGLNRGVVSDPAAPFGGVKQSGVGREGGHEGLLEYIEEQYIAVDW